MDKCQQICKVILVQMAEQHPHWQRLPLSRICQIVARLMPKGLDSQEFMRVINIFELITDIKLP